MLINMNRNALQKITALLGILVLGVIFSASMLDSAYAKESPSGSGTLVIANDILKVAIEDVNGTNGIGTFTIATNGSHPNPNEDVFYDGANEDPWSSFTTIRVEDTHREYITSSGYKEPSQGYTIQYLDDYYPVVVKESENKATISWTTIENLNVTLLIHVRGTTLADTVVEVTVTIRNDDTTAHSVAVRHEWDIMIQLEDDSWIRVWTNPSSPQTWTENETDWLSPDFEFWEATNNPYAPAFSIYGSTILPALNPQPTPPDRFVYASWESAYDTAFNFTTSGDWGMDSAVLYYWDADLVPSGGQISRTAYVTTAELEPTAFTWSIDDVGNSKSVFNLTDDVYIMGQGFPADTNVTIYLIPDGSDTFPADSIANATAITNSTGDLPVTLVWSHPLTLGKYDIWIDVNQNGVFDAGDSWNSQSIGIFATEVIPEFPSIIILSMLMTMILLTSVAYRGKQLT
jgi:hypothetical protein